MCLISIWARQSLFYPESHDFIGLLRAWFVGSGNSKRTHAIDHVTLEGSSRTRKPASGAPEAQAGEEPMSEAPEPVSGIHRSNGHQAHRCPWTPLFGEEWVPNNQPGLHLRTTQATAAQKDRRVRELTSQRSGNPADRLALKSTLGEAPRKPRPDTPACTPFHRRRTKTKTVFRTRAGSDNCTSESLDVFRRWSSLTCITRGRPQQRQWLFQKSMGT